MSNNRPPSSRSPERNPSSRRANDYYSESSNRPSSRSSSSQPSNTRKATSRPPNTQGSPSRSRNPENGKPTTRPSNQRTERPPVKRRRRRSRLLPLLLLIAVLAILALALRFFLSLGSSNNSENLTLEFSSQTLVVGETAKASVSGLPDDYHGTITYSSSDSEIVKIDADGTMHAKKKGDVTIAAMVDGKNIPRTIRVIELLEGIKSITLNQTNAAILSGETLQLKASVEFETDENISPPIIWSSSNTSVARVSNDGLVTARDVGSASITATLGNQSAVCVITVEKNPNSDPVESSEGTETSDETAEQVEPKTTNEPTSSNTSSTGGNGTTGTNKSSSNSAVKSLALSQNFAYLNVNETMTLEAAVSPVGTPLSWSSSDSSIATVSSAGVIKAKATGSVVITVKAGSLTASCTIQVDPASEEDQN